MKNIPILESDPFTRKVSLEWESIGGNKFYEKVLNGTVNMVSTKPDINRLLLTVNHLDGRDYLILRHPDKDYMLEPGDKFYILFTNDEVLEFEIERKSFHLFSSSNDTLKNVYENRIVLYEEDLESLSSQVVQDWRILTSGNRKIEGMRSFGNSYHHNYEDKSSLQNVLKSLFQDYKNEIRRVDKYEPLSRLEENERSDTYKVEECHLYLMKDSANGYYKIGISNKPKFQEKTLQSEKPTIELISSKVFASRKIALAFESSLHRIYEDKRLRGEWFELSAKEATEIRQILK